MINGSLFAAVDISLIRLYCFLLVNMQVFAMNQEKSTSLLEAVIADQCNNSEQVTFNKNLAHLLTNIYNNMTYFILV